jgi:hypothetical protein
LNYFDLKKHHSKHNQHKYPKLITEIEGSIENLKIDLELKTDKKPTSSEGR